MTETTSKYTFGVIDAQLETINEQHAEIKRLKKLVREDTSNICHTTVKPKYKHFCSDYIFLGTCKTGSAVCDLYFRPLVGTEVRSMNTVLAKYSDRVCDYSSCHPANATASGRAELFVAAHLAREKGLVP